MASGHVNRIQRPNTWQHRPSLRREESSLPTRSRPHMAHRVAWCGAVICPWLGVDRKRPADGQTVAFDPSRKSTLAQQRPNML